MNRITKVTPDGSWSVANVPGAEIPDGLYGALCKLKDYEDICSSPRIVASYMDDALGPVRYRLIDEDAEELTGAEYRDFMQQVKIEEVLRLACLDKLYTPADCRLITPEEYDREYGEDDHG